ncbi:MAG: hypothetical protein ABH821_02650 [archaeon]
MPLRKKMTFKEKFAQARETLKKAKMIIKRKGIVFAETEKLPDRVKNIMDNIARLQEGIKENIGLGKWHKAKAQLPIITVAGGTYYVFRETFWTLWMPFMAWEYFGVGPKVKKIDSIISRKLENQFRMLKANEKELLTLLNNTERENSAVKALFNFSREPCLIILKEGPEKRDNLGRPLPNPIVEKLPLDSKLLEKLILLRKIKGIKLKEKQAT